MLESIRFRGLTTALVVVSVMLACAADDVIININPDSGDSIVFSVPFDSLFESVDTIIIDGDTIILTVLDTIITPGDTVVLTVTDTVEVVDTIIDSGTGDTTFVVDTVVETSVDTVFVFDTVFETQTDTIIQVDTLVVVDTVVLAPRELGFGVEALALEVGESQSLEVTITNLLGQPVPSGELTWLSSSPAIAAVNQAGTVTAVSMGSSEVFAIAEQAGLSATIGVEVSDPMPPPGSVTGLDWFCDWSFGTGTDFAALRGTSQRGSGLGECFGAFTASGRDTFLVAEPQNPAHGFPPQMTNVLKVILDRNMTGSMMTQIDNGWRRPQVGEYVFFRSYDYNDMAVGVSANVHMLHTGTSTSGYSMRFFHANYTVKSDGGYSLDFDPMFNQDAGPGQGRFRNADPVTKVGQTYRREWRYHRFHADSMRVQLRTYDANNQLVETGADYECFTGSCVDVGGFGGDTIGQRPLYVNDWVKLQGLELGNNGAEPNDPATPQAWYWGGIAVRVSNNPNDWIGPYPSGPEGGN